jgi:hypothetical protein
MIATEHFSCAEPAAKTISKHEGQKLAKFLKSFQVCPKNFAFYNFFERFALLGGMVYLQWSHIEKTTNLGWSSPIEQDRPAHGIFC